MKPVELNDTAKGRVTGMIGLRQIVNELIQYQLEDFRPGVGLESVVGQADRPQQLRPLCDILPGVGAFGVHPDRQRTDPVPVGGLPGRGHRGEAGGTERRL